MSPRSVLARLGATVRDWFGPFLLGRDDRRLREVLAGGLPSATGLIVTPETALTFSAVWAAVQTIARDIAALPLVLYRETPRGKEPAPDLRLYRVLHDEPNPEMTSATWREYAMTSVLLWGNAVAEIQRDNTGRVIALWPIEPWRVAPYRTPQGDLRYRVAQRDGRAILLEPSEVLHIPGLPCAGYDPVWGISPIEKARESIGLGLAAERFGAAFFGNGATFGGILSHPAQLSEPAHERLRRSIQERHQGVDRAHRFLILEEGMQYHALGVPPEAAQFLATRKFQVTEIARWFGVPPHKLADLERSTFSNIEQQQMEYVTHTLLPWLEKIEQELNRKLISPLERGRFVIEFKLDGLLRGDTIARHTAYAVGRQWGLYSINDMRRLENLPLLDGPEGDMHLVPANMWPADRVGELIDRQVRGDDAREATTPREERAAPPLAVTLAHRALAADVMRRMLRREADKLTSAASNPETFRQRADDFYAHFADTLRSALLPACAMYCALTGDTRGAEAVARELAKAHVAQSRRALADCDPADVPALVERWQIERVNVVPDLLLQGLLTQGGSNRDGE